MSLETLTPIEQPGLPDEATLGLDIANQTYSNFRGTEEWVDVAGEPTPNTEPPMVTTPEEQPTTAEIGTRNHLLGSVMLSGALGISGALEKRLQGQWSDTRSQLETVANEGRHAVAIGDTNKVADAHTQITNLTDSLKTPLSYKIGSRLGLVPDITVRKQAEKRRHEQVIASGPVHISGKDLEAAKAAGDRVAYQKALLELADRADRNESLGIPAATLEKQMNHIDREVAAIEPGSATLAQQTLEAANADKKTAERDKSLETERKWLDNDRVLELKDSIDREVATRTKEATIAPGQYQLGFNKQRLEAEVTQKYLAKYFGHSIEELGEGKFVPLRIQNRLQDQLDKPMSELQGNTNKNKLHRDWNFSPQNNAAYAKNTIAQIDDYRRAQEQHFGAAREGKRQRRAA